MENLENGDERLGRQCSPDLNSNWGRFYSSPEFEIEFGVRVEPPPIFFAFACREDTKQESEIDVAYWVLCSGATAQSGNAKAMMPWTDAMATYCLLSNT